MFCESVLMKQTKELKDVFKTLIPAFCKAVTSSFIFSTMGFSVPDCCRLFFLDYDPLPIFFQ